MATTINAGRVRFVSRGTYNNSTQYYLFDLVDYNGSSYIAKENTLGNLPTNTQYWQLIAEKGNTGSTGQTGPVGPTGNGIQSITKTATSGLVDTYTITYTNGNKTTFTVTNGEDANTTEITNLKNENAYLQNVVRQAFTEKSASGTELTIDNTIEARMDLKLNGNTSQNGEPTPDTPQEIHCVKRNNVVTISNGNVLPNNLSDGSMNGITYTINDDKSIKISGTATSRCEPNLYDGAGYTIPAGVYKNTTSYNIIGYTGTEYIVFSANVSANLTKDVTFKQLFFRVENGATVNETIYPQIILSSKTDTSYVPHEETEYEINLGNIELNAIEEFKDYFKKENGKWYKVENIGSYTFEGNENFSFTDVGTINQRFDIKTPELNIACLWDQQYKLFTHFRNKLNNDGIWGEYYMTGKWLIIKDNDNIITSLEDFKAWLSVNKPTLYYVKTSAIDVEITDTTLINQLNEISQALSKKGTTIISQSNDDLPFNLDVIALTK